MEKSCTGNDIDEQYILNLFCMYSELVHKNLCTSYEYSKIKLWIFNFWPGLYSIPLLQKNNSLKALACNPQRYASHVLLCVVTSNTFILWSGHFLNGIITVPLINSLSHYSASDLFPTFKSVIWNCTRFVASIFKCL